MALNGRYLFARQPGVDDLNMQLPDTGKLVMEKPCCCKRNVWEAIFIGRKFGHYRFMKQIKILKSTHGF